MARAGGDGRAGSERARGTGPDLARDRDGARAAAGADPDDAAAFARSARFWLRAFPRRWRAVHADEALAVLVELAPPGARRLATREAAGLVGAGWATRWRRHPGPMTWLAYRLLDHRLPARYRAWAYDDITGALFPVRISWPWVLSFSVYALLSSRGSPGVDRGPMVLWVVVLALGLLMPSGPRRRMAILRHVAPRPGDVLERGTLVIADGSRRRLRAHGCLSAVAAVAGTVTFSAWATVALAPLGWWWRWIPAGWTQGLGPVTDRRAAVVAGAAGLVLAAAACVLARRRSSSLAAGLPDQPWRTVARIGARQVVGLVAWTAAGVALSVAELVGVLALSWSVAVAVIGPSVAVSAVVAARALRPRARIGAGVTVLTGAGLPEPALVDVWRVLTGRQVRVDGPVPVVVPIGGEMPVGAVAAAPPLGGPPTTLMA